MLIRHTKVREAVEKIADEDLDNYVLCASLERKVGNFLERLDELQDVLLKIQRGD